MKFAIKALRHLLRDERRWFASSDDHIRVVKKNIGRQHTAKECSCVRWHKRAAIRINELERAIAILTEASL